MTIPWQTMQLVDDHDNRPETTEYVVGTMIDGQSITPVCFGTTEYKGHLSINEVRNGHLTRRSMYVFQPEDLRLLKIHGALIKQGFNGVVSFHLLPSFLVP